SEALRRHSRPTQPCAVTSGNKPPCTTFCPSIVDWKSWNRARTSGLEMTVRSTTSDMLLDCANATEATEAAPANATPCSILDKLMKISPGTENMTSRNAIMFILVIAHGHHVCIEGFRRGRKTAEQGHDE